MGQLVRGERRGGGGGPLVGTQVFEEPIDALTLNVTIGDVALIARPGPVEVSMTSVAGSAAGASIVNGHLVLDYTWASVGVITIHAPADLLSFDLRVCIGDVAISGIAGDLYADVRIGNVVGDDLHAEVTVVDGGPGTVTLDYATAPFDVAVDGLAGLTTVRVPADTCDCDVAVDGIGLARLKRITDDPAADLAIWARRSLGTIVVEGI